MRQPLEGVSSIRFMHEMRNTETAACCEITAVHMDRQARNSTPFADTVRALAESQLAIAEPAGA
jgi:acyl-CoA thioester hydrolase